ncbi:MAG: nucleotidyltransferase domain-containing protein [Candidatus Margulisbacteria bacterium]|nr:nucleotidyltransferase domain-containing protein [Candidatus Margulisiibacteriota bacterium]
MSEIIRQDQQIIEKFKDKLLKQAQNNIDKILFFGSRARGLGRPDSDYDVLLVVSQKKNELIDAFYDVVTEFLQKYGVDISLKIYTVNEYNKKIGLPMPFFINIKKYGVEIWNKAKQK